jgi:hypothetical protein
VRVGGSEGMAHPTKYLPATLGRVVTGSWSRLPGDVLSKAGFTGVSSHTMTAVAPMTEPIHIHPGNGGAFPVFADAKHAAAAAWYVVGGEDGPRTLVPPERSVWKYQVRA